MAVWPFDIAHLLLVQLAVGSLLLVIILYIFRDVFYPCPLDHIPYNRESADRILGDLPAIKASDSLSKWLAFQPIKHQSPLFQAFVRPFSRPWVIVADHHEAAEICIRRLKDFDRGEGSIAPFQGVLPGAHITLKSADPRFRKSKELVRDLMTPSFLNEVSAPEIYNQFKTLLKLWTAKSRMSQGRPFSVSRSIHHAALDIIMGAAFGLKPEQTQLVREINTLEADQSSLQNATDGPDIEFQFKTVPLGEELAAFTGITNSVALSIKSPFPKLFHFLYRHLSPKMRKARRLVKSLQYRELANGIHRQRTGQAQRCAVDQILARESGIAHKTGRQPDYYSEAIIGELMTYLIGGHETTSSALQWGINYLTVDQRVQGRLHEALDQAHQQAQAESRMPNLSEIIHSRIPYLDAVIEEVLRHSHPFGMCIRESTIDTQILGVPIPRGTTVVLLTQGPSILTPVIPFDQSRSSDWVRSRREKLLVNEDFDIAAFIPERWLRMETAVDGVEQVIFDASSFPVQAFGLGPRSCFGKRLSYLEMKIFFTLVFWEFDLLPLPPTFTELGEVYPFTRNPKEVFGKLRHRSY